MDELRLKAVMLCDAGNRSVGLNAVSDYLCLVGFGTGAALRLRGKTPSKG